MEILTHFVIAAAITFCACLIGMTLFLAFLRQFGFYVTVPERTCMVYMLFGKVIGQIDEPGFHFLPNVLGLRAFLVHWFGQRHTVDLRIDQQYLRSQPVNSEEGAPMGVGIWYEMYVCHPVDYLFRNADPRGSLATNLSNATVRCLSNMPLSQLLENRHEMSKTVRDEVSEKSTQWGYKLGTVYIRKVHFRDAGMIRQIEEKVVNRLRQVTSAIRQAGANQVSVITSTAERLAAVEFAKAAAMRPKIVGATLAEISKAPEIEKALFEILETQKAVSTKGQVILIPSGSDLLPQLLASRGKIATSEVMPQKGNPAVSQ